MSTIIKPLPPCGQTVWESYWSHAGITLRFLLGSNRPVFYFRSLTAPTYRQKMQTSSSKTTASCLIIIKMYKTRQHKRPRDSHSTKLNPEDTSTFSKKITTSKQNSRDSKGGACQCVADHHSRKHSSLCFSTLESDALLLYIPSKAYSRVIHQHWENDLWIWWKMKTYLVHLIFRVFIFIPVGFRFPMSLTTCGNKELLMSYATHKSLYFTYNF